MERFVVSLPVVTSSGQMTLPLRMWALKKKARPKCRAFLYTFRSPERLRANVLAKRTREAWQECGDAGEAFDFIRGVAKKTHKD